MGVGGGKYRRASSRSFLESSLAFGLLLAEVTAGETTVLLFYTAEVRAAGCLGPTSDLLGALNTLGLTQTPSILWLRLAAPQTLSYLPPLPGSSRQAFALSLATFYALRRASGSLLYHKGA